MSDAPHPPDILSVERHWLAALAIVVVGHALGHIARDVNGPIGVAALIGGIVAFVAGGARLQWLLYGTTNARNRQERRRWLRPLDGERAPVQNRADGIPDDIYRSMVATLVGCVLGLAVVSGVFVPGIAPALMELAIGSALVAAWWVWARRD